MVWERDLAKNAGIPHSARDNELWTSSHLALGTIANPGTHSGGPSLYSSASLFSHRGRRKRTTRRACSGQASGRSRTVSDRGVADTSVTMCFQLTGISTRVVAGRISTFRSVRQCWFRLHLSVDDCRPRRLRSLFKGNRSGRLQAANPLKTFLRQVRMAGMHVDPIGTGKRASRK